MRDLNGTRDGIYATLELLRLQIQRCKYLRERRLEPILMYGYDLVTAPQKAYAYGELLFQGKGFVSQGFCAQETCAQQLRRIYPCFLDLTKDRSWSGLVLARSASTD